jgi:hypothetical protein
MLAICFFKLVDRGIEIVELFPCGGDSRQVSGWE